MLEYNFFIFWQYTVNFISASFEFHGLVIGLKPEDAY